MGLPSGTHHKAGRGIHLDSYFFSSECILQPNHAPSQKQPWAAQETKATDCIKPPAKWNNSVAMVRTYSIPVATQAQHDKQTATRSWQPTCVFKPAYSLNLVSVSTNSTSESSPSASPASPASPSSGSPAYLPLGVTSSAHVADCMPLPDPGTLESRWSDDDSHQIRAVSLHGFAQDTLTSDEPPSENLVPLNVTNSPSLKRASSLSLYGIRSNASSSQNRWSASSSLLSSVGDQLQSIRSSTSSVCASASSSSTSEALSEHSPKKALTTSPASMLHGTATGPNAKS